MTTPAWLSSSKTATRGLNRGLRLFVSLIQVMAPAYLAVAVLKRTPALEWLSHAVAPGMNLLGLPSEAAVPMVISWCVNLYAGIGAMQALNLTGDQITQLAVVTLIAHNLIVEIGIVARLRTRWFLIGLFRLACGLGMGAVMHYAFGFNQPGLAPDMDTGPQTSVLPWSSADLWMADAGGLLSTLFKTFSIVVPLMIALEYLRSGPWLERLSLATARPLRVLGLEPESILPFWAGILLGIVYGAGLMIDAAERDGFGGRQAFLVSVFLGVCHAVVEDTLLFVNLGASVFWITVPRVLLATILTWTCARILARRPQSIPAVSGN